jgi:LemA protein
MKRWGCFAAVSLIVLIVIIITGVFWGNYNALKNKEQALDSQRAQLEAQYQFRYDLIADLVAAVKGAMAQEQTVFNEIAQALGRYSEAVTDEEKAAASAEVETALASLLAVMDNYPALRSDPQVTALIAELAATANSLNAAGLLYNAKARDYNTALKQFPDNILVTFFDFESRTYYGVVGNSP